MTTGTDTLQWLSHSTKNSRRLWNLICNFLLSRILWLQVVKCSNVRHFPSPSRICKCCGCVFFRGYHHIICHPLLKKGIPCVCKTYHWGRGGRKLLLTLAPERGKFTYSQLHKKCMPRSTPRGWPGLQMTELVQWSVFQVMPKWQTKFRSVFHSDDKTRNEIAIRFSKLCENEKRNTKFKTVFES